MIPYGRQDIDQADIDAVVGVLRSDFLTQGPAVPEFENSVSKFCSAEHAVAVNSATAALHLACLALGLGPGDRLWTSPTTFVASANVALLCGAEVDFVDIDPKTYNMSVENLAFKLNVAQEKKMLPKVVMPVHLCGQSCEMEEIKTLSRQYGFKIVEDASHAIGGSYKNKPVGCCEFSDITVFSFHPVKIITTGEGGIALTHSAELADKMRLLRGHGITTQAECMETRPIDEIWNYQQIALGYNYRMTDIQAILGVSQMKRLGAFISKRHEIAQRYDLELGALDLEIPWQHPDAYSSYHLYPIRVKSDRRGLSQRHIYDRLRKAGILVNLHYIPVYRQPYYEKLGFSAGHCPQAEKYFKETLSLPIYPMLSYAQQSDVITSLKTSFL